MQYLWSKPGALLMFEICRQWPVHNIFRRRPEPTADDFYTKGFTQLIRASRAGVTAALVVIALGCLVELRDVHGCGPVDIRNY